MFRNNTLYKNALLDNVHKLIKKSNCNNQSLSNGYIIETHYLPRLFKGQREDAAFNISAQAPS